MTNSSIPEYVTRVHESFDQQTVMATMGAQLTEVTAGTVTIELPYNRELCQQHGFLHAGIVTTIVDSACGYAAYTLMPAEAEVLTVEFKVNFMVPAKGERFVAQGRVIRAGRTLTITQGDVWAILDGERKHIAMMQATVMTIRP